ncbi:MAG: hypothetical protein H6517_07430 [Microthrixaceae bacterium]|nr:hypothetical protein [Microthrixaceae bacterium]MCB9387638.1 hypothetical protein [Microthrixaceae bacterium]MCO5320734.1 hypothetical protein [Microthrixaceae bacterium]
MSILAAIAFDPAIRGVLVVATGVGVLIGSIYLIVSTNVGFRQGLLITVAALSGWCMTMGAVWTIYGIGLRGEDPSWIDLEVNFSRDGAVQTPEVEALPRTEELADPADIYAELIEQDPEIQQRIEEAEGEGFVPESLTQLVTLLPDQKVLLDEDLGEWRILPESDARRGDAVAAADAFLVAQEAFGDQTAGAYTVHDVFFFGGKEGAEPETVPGEDGLLTSAWNRIMTTLQLKNPPLYAAVTVQKNIPQSVAPGEAPPPPVVDESAEIVTVIMERNLGNRRLVPAMFAIFSGLIFAVSAWMLHSRDRLAMQTRSEWDPTSAT